MSIFSGQTGNQNSGGLFNNQFPGGSMSILNSNNMKLGGPMNSQNMGGLFSNNPGQNSLMSNNNTNNFFNSSNNNSLYQNRNTNTNNSFGSSTNTSNNSLFNTNTNNSSLFPNTNTNNNSLFSNRNTNTNNLFTNTNTNSLFPNTNTNTNSLFPNTNSNNNSLFPNTNTNNNSLFPNTNTNTNSLFPNTNTNSLFPSTNRPQINTGSSLFNNNTTGSSSLFNNLGNNSILPINQQSNSLFSQNQSLIGQNQNQNQFNGPFSSLNSSSTLKDFVKLLNGNDQVLCYYLNNSKEIDKAIGIIKSYDGKELDELEDNLNKLYANLANLDYILNKESMEVNEIHKQLLDDKINTQLMNPDSYLREMTPFKEINPIFLNNYKEFEKVQKYCKETIIYLEQAFNSQPVIKSHQTIPAILKAQYQCLLDISSRVSKCNAKLNDKKLKLLK